jgi:hypothetical protein
MSVSTTIYDVYQLKNTLRGKFLDGNRCLNTHCNILSRAHHLVHHHFSDNLFNCISFINSICQERLGQFWSSVVGIITHSNIPSESLKLLHACMVHFIWNFKFIYWIKNISRPNLTIRKGYHFA